MAEPFHYRVAWSPEEGEFVGTCAEFPSLSHLAADQDAALRGIREPADVVADLRGGTTRPAQARLDHIARRAELLLRSPDPQAEMRWTEERLFEQDLWHGNAPSNPGDWQPGRKL
jgi:hypothetical protein